MSTPTKKKAQPKPSVPTPKYANTQSVFLIDYSRDGHGEVLQGEILVSRTIKFPVVSDTGKVTGSETRYEYDVRTAYGTFRDRTEYALYPNLQTVAIAYTNNHVHLLK